MTATVIVPGLATAAAPTRTRARWTATDGPAVGVLGTGVHLPDRVVGNLELATLLGVDPAWIDVRGVRQRRRAAHGQSTADLVTGAARHALARTGVAPDAVSVLVVAAETDRRCRPAALVRQRLGLAGAAALDVGADAVAALAVAHRIVLATGGYGLVVGAQVQEVDPFDPAACARLGDGAGALVLGATEPGRGLRAVELAGDGPADVPAFLARARVDPRRITHPDHVERDLGDTGPASIPLALALAGNVPAGDPAPGDHLLLVGPPAFPSLALLAR